MLKIKILFLLVFVYTTVNAEFIGGVDTLQLWQAYDFLTDSIITPSQEEIDSMKIIYESNDNSKNTIKYDLQYTWFSNTIEAVHYYRFYAITGINNACIADRNAYYFGDFSWLFPDSVYFMTREGYFGMIKNTSYGNRGELIFQWVLQLDGTGNLCEPPNDIVKIENFNNIKKLYFKEY